MMDWQSLLGGEPGDGVRLYEGTINEDASSLTDEVTVIVHAFDRETKWGPAPWMPRVSSGVALVMPQQGDRCIVALAETEDPGEPEVWIIGWWP